MEYTPILFTKDGQTTLSADPADEIRLIWEGWIKGSPVPTPRSRILATLADLDALRDRLLAQIGSGGGVTTSFSAIVDPNDPSLLIVTTGIGAIIDPNDPGILLVTIGASAALDPADPGVLLMTI